MNVISQLAYENYLERRRLGANEYSTQEEMDKDWQQAEMDFVKIDTCRFKNICYRYIKQWTEEAWK